MILHQQKVLGLPDASALRHKALRQPHSQYYRNAPTPLFVRCVPVIDFLCDLVSAELLPLRHEVIEFIG